MAFSMSGDVNRDVTITFIGKDNASSAMRSISSQATRTTGITTKLGKALKYVAAAAATALAAAAGLAAAAIWNVTKAAYYDDIAMKKLAFTQSKAQNATRAQTKATSDLIDKLELATGVADDEMRPAMAALAVTGMSVKKSQELLQVALDVSVAKGKSVTSVAEALAKAYNGQTTSLQRLGVKTTDAAGNALSFSEILGELRRRTEGAAKAAGKTDPLARLTAAWNQAKEALGQGFLPILRQFTRYVISTVVPWVKDKLVPAVKRFSAWIKDEAVPWIQDKLIPAAKGWYQYWHNELLPLLKDTGKNLWNIVGAVKDLTEAIGEMTGAKEGKGVARFFQLLTMSISNALIPLRLAMAYWEFMIEKWTWVIDNAGRLVDALESVGGAIRGGAGWVQDHLSPFAAGGHLDARASGGPVRRASLVGEHGPELIVGNYVHPHSRTIGMGNAPVVINVNGAIDPVMTARQIERILAKGRRVTGAGGLATA